MRVEIKPRATTKGILRKRKSYVVNLEVLFTEEETAIIKENNLEGDVIVERTRPGFRGREVDASMTFQSLMRGPDKFHAVNQIDAAGYINQVKESLESAKAYLVGNTGGLPDETFEL